MIPPDLQTIDKKLKNIQLKKKKLMGDLAKLEA
jgi:hypothetical protein